MEGVRAGLTMLWQRPVGMQGWDGERAVSFQHCAWHEHARGDLCSLPGIELHNRSRLRRRGTRSPRDKANELADNLARAGRAHHLLNAVAVLGHVVSDELDCAGGDDVEEIGRFSLLKEWLVRREAHVVEVRQHSLKHFVACLREESQPLQVVEHGAALRCVPA
jgi:hypothetical protein